MPRRMLAIRCSDSSQSLQAIIGQISIELGIGIEAAWHRVFGPYSATLLMLAAGDQHRLNDRIGNLCQRWNGYAPGPVLTPVCIPDDYEPYWVCKPVHTIFTLEYSAAKSCNQCVTVGLRDLSEKCSVDVVQHDSGIGDQGRHARSFRVYSDSVADIHSLEEFISSCMIQPFTDAGIGGARLGFGFPPDRRIAELGLHAAGEAAQSYAYVIACVQDKINLYSDMFDRIEQDIGKVSRSCCRGLGGVGILMFAVPTQEREDIVAGKIMSLSRKYEAETTGLGGEGYLCGCLSDMMPHGMKVNGSPATNALISRVRYGQDKNGLLHEVTGAMPAKESSIYILDAQPSPSENKKYTIRSGTAFANQADCKKAAAGLVGGVSSQMATNMDVDRFSLHVR